MIESLDLTTTGDFRSPVAIWDALGVQLCVGDEMNLPLLSGPWRFAQITVQPSYDYTFWQNSWTSSSALSPNSFEYYLTLTFRHEDSGEVYTYRTRAAREERVTLSPGWIFARRSCEICTKLFECLNKFPHMPQLVA